MCETTVRAGVCRLGLAGRWLATGWDGGYHDATAAYNVSVPEGFDRTDLDTYADERLADAGFERDGPVLFTGVDVADARGARAGPVTVLVTAGLSNPARLQINTSDECEGSGRRGGDADHTTGTVNLLVATSRALSDGALATLLGTAVEAKAATLQATTGFSGTTTDAVAVGCESVSERTAFAGSATDVGAATRACVRDAVLASLDARDGTPPESVQEAEYGVVTDGRADVFRP